MKAVYLLVNVWQHPYAMPKLVLLSMGHHPGHMQAKHQ
jgi:hypothetical protein